MHDAVSNFINLDTITILYLFGVGFVGGLVSGFIGSGGAFVLTPGMMSLGVPGLMAVASNMCHKFPKALVGAMKRFKYGQVDVKLGVILGISAEAGVLYGAGVQEKIKATYGDAGSDRKSTRQNSSHQLISYAVFCLKKKRNRSEINRRRGGSGGEGRGLGRAMAF